MTLEDFFTLTEMKDGLTTLARVDELFTVMQKEKDCVVKNIGEATRQWSTVATTIAATENRHCLDLFIQLDGLWFIDRWLKDAHKFSSDTGNSFVEESILALLRALEKLQIDNERSVSSGIWMTVKNLVGHSSSTIQDRARALFDGWKVTRHTATPQVVQKAEVLHDDGIDASTNRVRDSGRPECSSLDKSSSHVSDLKNIEPSGEEKLPLNFAAAMQPVRVDEEQVKTPEKALGSAVVENGPPDPVHSSNMVNHVDESLPVKEEAPLHHSEGIAVAGASGFAVTMHGKQLNECTNDAKQMQETSSPEKVGAREISTVSIPLEQRALSLSEDVATTLESALEPDLKKEIDAKDQDYCSKHSPFPESRNASWEDNRMDDKGSPNHCRSTLVLEAKDQVEACNSDALHNSSDDDCKWGEAKDSKILLRIEDAGVVEKAEEHSGDGDGDGSENDSDCFKPTMDAKDCIVVSKRSDMELDYDMVDPLEVARQVAIEVEREVDCREPSCSTSEKTSGGGLRQPESPDSTNGKESQSSEGPCKKLPTVPNLSLRALQTGADPVINAETLGADHENCIYDMPSSQVTEAAQESEAHMDKGFSGFDLNQEVCSEDTDRPMNQASTPISVVSASRAAAASGLPIAPLQFEGALGWKGSAATSAFRRIPEGDKTLSMSGSRNNSKQRLDYLDFDLNVAEGGEDKVEDLLSAKQIPNSSGFPSGEESSIEAASPRRSDRMQLDLNRVSDGGVDASLDWRREGQLFLNQNGRQSPSRSSSSSSMQPPARNFDLNLNDQPLFLQDSSSDHPYLGKSFQNLNASGTAFKSDESVISILGARVEVKRKDPVPQTLPVPNGRISEHPMDINLGRSGSILGGLGSSIPYAHSPVYGFNSLASGSGMPFSSAMYGPPGGPIPYMVDSRGAPVVPQLMGSASSLPPAFSQAAPFMMSMTGAGASLGSNGAGPSRHNFDLNSGLMIEGGNRDAGAGLRQFLNPSQGRSLDEHLRAAANSQQPSPSPGLGLKRQEPDSGWEPYPFNYKHHQPSWK